MESREPELGTVVVGVSFTPASEAAVEWVGRRLPAQGITLLVHAIDLHAAKAETPAQEAIRAEARTSARASLDRIRESFLADRDVELVVELGDPSHVLSDVARERNADLVVIGPHRGHPALEKFVGSTAQRLIHESDVPVLLTRRPTRRD